MVDGKLPFHFYIILIEVISFKSAAHYSETKSRPATIHYIYTVEAPDLTDDNHIDFKRPVHQEITKRAERIRLYSCREIQLRWWNSIEKTNMLLDT